MTTNERVAAFVALGERLAAISDEDFANLAIRVSIENRWFTAPNLRRAINGIAYMLHPAQLTELLAGHPIKPVDSPKKIGVVMAGNIPFAGFHDSLCVLLSGHVLMARLSASDKALPTYVLDLLCEIEPRMKELILISDRLNDAEAYIATGSDNTARYFEYYFRNKPHIIRHNRNSAAILTGKETELELTELADDIFAYFGLGCRNVTKLFVPAGYDFFPLLDSLAKYPSLNEHTKYMNNYEYHRALFMLNLAPYTDTGTLLVREAESLSSPPSVMHYGTYADAESLKAELEGLRPKLQCVVATGTSVWPEALPFGTAQLPNVWDFADGVDTLKFLASLS